MCLKRPSFFAFLVLLMAALPISTEAKKSGDNPCAYTFVGWDLCKKSERKRQREAFGLPPVEVYRSLGTEAVRVFEDNANNWPVVAIIFYEDRNLVPRVEVRRPLGPDGTNWYPPLIARIESADWSALKLNRRLLETPYTDDSICTDGYTRVVEAIDASQTIVTRVEHNCGENPVNEYFDSVARLALDQFAHCKTLQFQSNMSPSRILSYCLRLDGNKQAAAELYNLIEESGLFCCLKPDSGHSIEQFFDDNYRLTYPGFLAAHTRISAANIWMELDPGIIRYYIGETKDRVRVEGTVELSVDEDDRTTKTTSAPFTSLWVRGADGQFRMRSYTVITELTTLRTSRTIKAGEIVEIPNSTPSTTSPYSTIF